MVQARSQNGISFEEQAKIWGGKEIFWEGKVMYLGTEYMIFC